jgi:hypothetical protein
MIISSDPSDTSTAEEEVKPENTTLEQVTMTPSPEPSDLADLDNNSLTNLLIGSGNDNTSMTSQQFRSHDPRDTSPQHGNYAALSNEDDEEVLDLGQSSPRQGRGDNQYTPLEDMDATFDSKYQCSSFV